MRLSGCLILLILLSASAICCIGCSEKFPSHKDIAHDKRWEGIDESIAYYKHRLTELKQPENRKLCQELIEYYQDELYTGSLRRHYREESQRGVKNTDLLWCNDVIAYYEKKMQGLTDPRDKARRMGRIVASCFLSLQFQKALEWLDKEIAADVRYEAVLRTQKVDAWVQLMTHAETEPEFRKVYARALEDYKHGLKLLEKHGKVPECYLERGERMDRAADAVFSQDGKFIPPSERTARGAGAAFIRRGRNDEQQDQPGER